jgi:hypothetical protein
VGIGGNVPWAWKSFCRGYNLLYMDRADDFPSGFFQHEWWPEPVNTDLRRELGHIRACAERMDLNAATPHNTLASTGYCLAQPGQEYLAYQPGQGSFDISLAPGSYECEWHSPRTGEAVDGGMVAARVEAHRFTSPFRGDAVLFLRRMAK